MKLLKKLGLLTISAFMILALTGCSKNVEGTLEEIMTKVYSNVADDEKPMMLGNMEVNDENIEGFLGTKDIKYKEILASESMVGAIAHSVVLVRVAEDGNVEEIKKEIEENVDPRKWICVGVEPENVIIKNKGDLIIVIIVEDENVRTKIEKGFDEL